jgi:hypothetical protein
MFTGLDCRAAANSWTASSLTVAIELGPLLERAALATRNARCDRAGAL